jgi:hypothetical protein
MKISQTMILLALVTGVSLSATGQSGSPQSAPVTTVPTASGATSDAGTQPPVTRRSTRKSRRRYVSPAPGSQPAAGSQTVGPDAAQRTRDAQILAAQKAQSAEIARQNAITTGNVVRERQAQQAEQRIQDAPGPGSQPLAADPAIQPTAGSNDPQGIQDAPGPAQTLPQAPPAQTTTPPAPQQTAPQS